MFEQLKENLKKKEGGGREGGAKKSERFTL